MRILSITSKRCLASMAKTWAEESMPLQREMGEGVAELREVNGTWMFYGRLKIEQNKCCFQYYSSDMLIVYSLHQDKRGESREAPFCLNTFRRYVSFKVMKENLTCDIQLRRWCCHIFPPVSWHWRDHSCLWIALYEPFRPKNRTGIKPTVDRQLDA